MLRDLMKVEYYEWFTLSAIHLKNNDMRESCTSFRFSPKLD